MKPDIAPTSEHFPVDPTTTKVVSQIKHEVALTTIRCAPTGNFIAAGAEDLNVHLWSIADENRYTLQGHDSWVRSIEFSLDGSRMYTACWGGVVKAWSLAAPEPKLLYSIQAHKGSARRVSISPDGKRLATCGNDRLVRVFSAENGEQLQQFAGHKRHVYGVIFHPHSEHIVSQDLVGVIKVWNLNDAKEERSFTAKVMTGYDNKFAADMGGSRDLQFHANGEQWASAGITNLKNGFAGDQDPIIVLFNWKTGEALQKFTAGAFKGVAWGVRFHGDGFIIGTGANKNGKGELWFYRPDAGKPFHTMKLASAARGLDLLPNNRLAIAHADGKISVCSMTAKAETAKA